mmetsp:Transcript_23011/g.58018  ORF Transcript_23011/g.58018 Transcript_23011/m.58018 type:complete len:201 (+) Transcript_23011:595-1197(+)
MYSSLPTRYLNVGLKSKAPSCHLPNSGLLARATLSSSWASNSGSRPARMSAIASCWGSVTRKFRSPMKMTWWWPGPKHVAPPQLPSRPCPAMRCPPPCRATTMLESREDVGNSRRLQISVMSCTRRSHEDCPSPEARCAQSQQTPVSKMRIRTAAPPLLPRKPPNPVDTLVTWTPRMAGKTVLWAQTVRYTPTSCWLAIR